MVLVYLETGQVDEYLPSTNLHLVGFDPIRATSFDDPGQRTQKAGGSGPREDLRSYPTEVTLDVDIEHLFCRRVNSPDSEIRGVATLVLYNFENSPALEHVVYRVPQTISSFLMASLQLDIMQREGDIPGHLFEKRYLIGIINVLDGHGHRQVTVVPPGVTEAQRHAPGILETARHAAIRALSLRIGRDHGSLGFLSPPPTPR
jgi:hypothetical protein